MNGFIKHLDQYKIEELNSYKYPILLQEIQTNYTQYNLGPSIHYHSHIPFQIPMPPEIQKITRTISVEINSLKDLIKLIEDNPYDPQYEYNIDLETLHHIKGELSSIDNMIGLRTFKQSLLDQLLYFLQNLHKGSEGDFKHTVLMGPPGTGKTEVAKLLGNMYSKIGTLSNPTFKKVTRGDLIAGYLGQTAIKTQKVIESCLGGVLFLDEAYSFSDPNQSDMFSKECIDTLCEALSDHKENLMVIIAGYEDALKHSFFSINPGLESRFLWRFTMDPYDSTELCDIFIKKTKDIGWNFENLPNSNWFETKKDKFLNYGRDMEGLLTYVKIAHGRRIYGCPKENRKCISIEDLEKGFQGFNKHKETKKSFLYDMYV